MALMNPRGWHSRGYLPHFDSPETLQFVTFRLFDSLPAEAVAKLRLMPGPIADADRDAFLDIGSGYCWLLQPEIAQIVEDALLHFDHERYLLIAWTIMPNHVHVPSPLPATPLAQSSVLGSASRHEWRTEGSAGRGRSAKMTIGTRTFATNATSNRHSAILRAILLRPGSRKNQPTGLGGIHA